MKKLIFILSSLLLVNCTLNKKFPKFDSKAYSGQELNNELFTGKKTIVIMGHIECPPMILALKDLETYQGDFDSSGVQILAFLENTEEHLDKFYQDTASIWGWFRNNFEIDTLTYPLIAECKCEKITQTKEGVPQISRHCRKLAWRVWTFSSPTFLLVNGNGKILKRKKGYPITGEKKYRRKWLLTFINE
jgi:hypothetical protein